MKVAIVYDRVNKWGGAERVLLALHKLFPDAPLFTSVYSKKGAPWAESFQKIIPSFFQKIIPAQKAHELFALFMPIVFESFSFDAFDVVISVTSEAAKGIITKSSTLHICVCLTPTRYLWSGYYEYLRNTIAQFIAWPLVTYLRKWDLIAAKRPDYFIAISQNVSNRIKKYYNRESVVIYPPVELASYVRRKRSRKKQNDGYFLLVSRISRFVPYKRIDLAIEAANKTRSELKVVGEGRDIEYFKKKAGPTVEFLGRLTDDALATYYKKCRALIFPGTEDFGLVMVEAQSFGKPVIAYRAGGALEIIKEGKTGEFFDKQNVRSLARVMANFHEKQYNIRACIENSQRFSFEKFEREFRSFLEKAVKEYFGNPNQFE